MKHRSIRQSAFLSFSKSKLYLTMLACSPLLVSQHSLAGPEGGRVAAGSGEISIEQKQTLIEQHSDRLAIDWDSFDLDADEVVSFMQPGTESVALNRILGGAAIRVYARSRH